MNALLHTAQKQCHEKHKKWFSNWKWAQKNEVVRFANLFNLSLLKLKSN